MTAQLLLVAGLLVVLGVVTYGVVAALLSRDRGENWTETVEFAGERAAAGAGGLATAARVSFVTGAAIAAAFADQFAALVAEFVGWAAGSPVVVSNLATLGLGVGTLQIAGQETSATMLLAVGAIVLVVAVGIRRSDAIRVRG